MMSDYNWNFTTAEDTLPPTVSSVSPGPDSCGQAEQGLNIRIEVIFNEPLDSTSIHRNWPDPMDVRLVRIEPWGGMNMPGTLTCSPSNDNCTKLVFDPADFEVGKTYRARVLGTVRDLAGNEMGSEYAWRFTIQECTEGDDFW